MKKEAYLSDTELEKLIREVENGETVPAPPDILSDILRIIHELEKGQPTHLSPFPEEKWFAALFRPPEKGTVREFRRYCFRVVFCSGAVIAMLFLSSKFPGFPQKEIPSRSQVLAEQKIRTRDDVLTSATSNPFSLIEEKIPWGIHLFN